MEIFSIVTAVLGIVVAIAGSIFIHQEFKNDLNKKNNKKSI